MERIIKERGSLVHPISYKITQQGSNALFRVTRYVNGEQSLGYYTDASVAMREQSKWLQDTNIEMDRRLMAAREQ